MEVSMAILTDEEIIKIVYEDKPNLFVEGVREPVDWFSKDSPVQPSSLDISIGGIYIPGSQLGKKGGEGDPYEEYILEPGQTAVVTSKEKFIFPNNIAAIGFPPSRLSIKGLLMTNPGHIDPGSDNELHFTVITFLHVIKRLYWLPVVTSTVWTFCFIKHIHKSPHSRDFVN